MRDGSLDDIVMTWMDEILEEFWGRKTGDNEAAVYFAILKYSVLGLVSHCSVNKTVTDYADYIEELLIVVRDEVSTAKNIFHDNGRVGADGLINGESYDRTICSGERERPSLYWSTDSWRKDFYDTFSKWFWDMKDYAAPAGRKKMDFLWEVGEVWFASGAANLVYYPGGGEKRWREVATMMRKYADLVEKDGMRSLSWARWGRYSASNRRSAS